MIEAPINDGACLDQLTQMARELTATTLIRNAAQQLGTAPRAIQWIRSLPQSDDDGSDAIQAIRCDVLQRVRLLPSDPNCFERAFAALVLLEALDPATRRALVSVEQPARHTAIVEKRGEGQWLPIDLFPRRNAFSWGDVGRGALVATRAVHTFVGKPILKFYLGETGGQLADEVGKYEGVQQPKDKQQPAAQPTPPQPPTPPRPPTPPQAPPAKSVTVEPPKKAAEQITATNQPTSPQPTADRRPFAFSSGSYRNQGGTYEREQGNASVAGAASASARAPGEAPQCWRLRR